jgi:hypothetical protein
VNVRPILHTQPLGLYNEILVGNLFSHHYYYPLSPTPFLSYLIYPSEWSTQRAATLMLRTMMLGQQRCQPTTATSADPRASCGDASSNAPNHAAKYGQHAVNPG